MKKVLTAVFAKALVLAASCDSKENGNKTAANYSAEETALGDSLSTSFGQMQAAQAQSTFNRSCGNAEVSIAFAVAVSPPHRPLSAEQ